MTAPRPAADWLRFTADETLGFLEGVERALDNGSNELVLVDGSRRPTGRFQLEAARRLVASGQHLRATLRDLRVPLEAPSVLCVEADAAGRVRGVAPDWSGRFLPVAEPSLSRAEFRNLLDAFLSTFISSTGDYVRGFEADFARFVGVRHGVATANGTVTLHLALLALGIGPGDEVIVPDLTFAATINAVMMAGATPVIVDADPVTWGMNVDGVEAALTPRTRALIPVHIFGRPCDMPGLRALADAKRLYVIEDCAEAPGARVGGRAVGAWSHVASFSFFANKIVTTGEGGMCTTDDPELAARMRTLRDHGMKPERRYWHEEVGYNYRMTNLAASIGQAQLDRVDALLAWRRELAERYDAALAGLAGVETAPALPAGFEPVSWFACALVPADKRAAAIEACRAANIDLRPFFNPLSIMPAYRRFARPCPVSADLAARGVNLPTSEKIGETEVARVAAAIRAALGSAAEPSRETHNRCERAKTKAKQSEHRHAPAPSPDKKMILSEARGVVTRAAAKRRAPDPSRTLKDGV